MRRYEAQARLFSIIKVARDVDLAQQIGRDMYFDLVDHDKVRHFRIWKQTPFAVFKEEVAIEFGISVQFQRFWICAKRPNHKYRPHRPLTAREEAQPVGQLREISINRHNAELNLFLEVEFGPDLWPIPPPAISIEDILLFFKLYDPQIGELRYVGRLFVKSSGKPIEILGKLNRMANFAPDEEIELYEEKKFKPSVMCEHLDKQISFRSSRIEHGDIIYFQKAPPPESEELFRYPDVPSFLEYAHNCQIRLKTEQEQEVRRRYEAQAHFFTIIKVARDEDLAQQIGRDIYFDLIDHHKVRHFRIWKQTPFSVFKEEVATEFGIPAQFQRFWIWAKRPNYTYRPHRPLTAQEEAQPVGQLREVSNETHNAELNLFLEVEFGPDLRPIPPPEISEENILLFFKLYEPEIGELQYVGRLFVKSSGKPIEILGKLNRMANFAPDEEIELYEEINFKPSVECEHLDKQISFGSSEIGDGDIICFQKAPLPKSEKLFLDPDLPDFLEYARKCQVESA